MGRQIDDKRATNRQILENIDKEITHIKLKFDEERSQMIDDHYANLEERARL